MKKEDRGSRKGEFYVLIYTRHTLPVPVHIYESTGSYISKPPWNCIYRQHNQVRLGNGHDYDKGTGSRDNLLDFFHQSYPSGLTRDTLQGF
jgi:hypothetical protein